LGYEELEYTPLWYITEIPQEDKPYLKGLIDANGNEILPCIYSDDDIYAFHRLIVFIENGKRGLMTFDGKVILPAIYTEIECKRNQFLVLKMYGQHRYASVRKHHTKILAEDAKKPAKYGVSALDGTIILPIEYNFIAIYNDFIIAVNNDGTTLYTITRKAHNE
jgi:hypothetical protein